MATATSDQSAIAKLVPRLKFLSEQCADLLERDLRDSEEQCLERHIRRIWERLEPAERDAIREEVEEPFRGKDAPQYYHESRCLRAITEHMRDEQGRCEV